jgi:hypothetical protein
MEIVTMEQYKEDLAELERQLAEANDRYVLLTDELWHIFGEQDRRDYAVQAKEIMAKLAEARKAAEWKDELLKEFDTAAGTILEDAGCLHDDGLICEICKPFVDARKKYADRINPPAPEGSKA